MVHFFLVLLLGSVGILILRALTLTRPAPPPNPFPQLVWWLFLVLDLIVLAWLWTGGTLPTVVLNK